jgi:biopolymer transport protein TolQ
MQGIEISGDVLDIVLRAGPMGKLVLLILLGFSVASWAIILHKWRMMRRVKRETRTFREIFAESDNLPLIYAATKQFQDSPLARIFSAGYAELRPYLLTKHPVRGRNGMADEFNGDPTQEPSPPDIARLRRTLSLIV